MRDRPLSRSLSSNRCWPDSFRCLIESRLDLQGNCTGAPPSFKGLTPPLASLRSRQCVLLAPFDVFYFREYVRHNIWINNLMLRLHRVGNKGATLVYWEPNVTKPESQLWLTNMGFQCDDEPAGRAMWLRKAPVFASGVHTLSTVNGRVVPSRLKRITLTQFVCPNMRRGALRTR
jgi:hypothetical protein